MPHVRLGDGDEFRPGAVSIHADALRIWAKVTAAGEAIAAMSTGNMALPGHQIARGESFDIITHAVNDTDDG